ncbi:MAG: hydrogenase maturation peptidase HycI [Candidatus Bathyarchaeia archaeon]
MSIRNELKSWLGGCRRLVILGVGNPLRGDDSLGLEILERIRGRVPRNVKLIYGGTVPENFIGKVGRLRPSHVLIIDAALFGGKPGEARLIPPEQIPDTTISTHTMPLNLLVSLIQKKTNAKVILLGIEPKNLGLGEEISREVKKSVERCAVALIEAIGGAVQRKH